MAALGEEPPGAEDETTGWHRGTGSRQHASARGRASECAVGGGAIGKKARELLEGLPASRRRASPGDHPDKWWLI